MKTLLNKYISSSVKTRLKYLQHDLLNSPLSSAWKILRRRQNLLVRHATWFDDLKTQGYTIIHNYLSKEQCKKAVIELKTAFESYPAFVHKKEDKRIFGIEQILPAARVGRKYGIAVTNGTAAIDAAFKKSAQSPLLEHIVNQKIEMP